jgi:uncharacterized membrane protein
VVLFLSFWLCAFSKAVVLPVLCPVPVHRCFLTEQRVCVCVCVCVCVYPVVSWYCRFTFLCRVPQKKPRKQVQPRRKKKGAGAAVSADSLLRLASRTRRKSSASSSESDVVHRRHAPGMVLFFFDVYICVPRFAVGVLFVVCCCCYYYCFVFYLFVVVLEWVFLYTHAPTSCHARSLQDTKRDTPTNGPSPFFLFPPRCFHHVLFMYMLM